ncbi:MAG: UrcA family protein, partial [Rhodospirillaceae bacterium]
VNAQQASTDWRPQLATIMVTASPIQNLREIQRLTVPGYKFLAISASVPVPYGDLNLAQESAASELDRRIRFAAQLVCRQLTIKYPPNIYPVMGGDTCERDAADNGLAEAETVIAAARN